MLLLKICRPLITSALSVGRKWSLEPKNCLVITFSTPGKSQTMHLELSSCLYKQCFMCLNQWSSPPTAAYAPGSRDSRPVQPVAWTSSGHQILIRRQPPLRHHQPLQRPPPTQRPLPTVSSNPIVTTPAALSCTKRFHLSRWSMGGSLTRHFICICLKS